MLKIRLKKHGKKTQPSYRIVISDSKMKRDGRCIEKLGVYSPVKHETALNGILISKYLHYGAKPTKAVKNLLIKAKII
jgi:small subunit ribosomal protein S16